MAERARPAQVDAGQLLQAAYAVFVLAAGGRSAVQLSLQAGRAPLAYGLSALAAVAYAVEFVLVRRARHRSGRRAVAAGSAVELAGVLSVGILSVLRRDLFPDATIWSCFGAGYAGVPVVLPLAALTWSVRGSPSGAAAGTGLCG